MLKNTSMKKKNYIAPVISAEGFLPDSLLTSSTFTQGEDTQVITPTNEEYGGEFQSRRSLWDDLDSDF